MTIVNLGTFNQGDEIQVTGNFTVTSSGTAINPSSVAARAKSPDGTVSTPTTANPQTGEFTFTFTPPNAVGEWLVELTGSGNVYAQKYGSFTVNPPPF